jgi:hypothetical protein
LAVVFSINLDLLVCVLLYLWVTLEDESVVKGGRVLASFQLAVVS